MTKKDYETIAACLGGAYAALPFPTKSLRASAVDDVRQRLMLEFKLDNPRFSEEKFLAAIEKWRKRHGGE